MRTAQGLWSTAQFTATSSCAGCMGGPCCGWGWSSFLIQFDYGLEKEWKAGTILLAHTVKLARAVWL